VTNDAAAIPILQLDDQARSGIAQTKATCPFIGSAVATGILSVRLDANNPLASVDDVRKLGNTGGGDLGDLLVLFAQGNHAFMKGAEDQLDAPAPAGFFSLEFPGSQGSHPGHSGILQGDPRTPGSGRFSQTDFDRLAAHAREGLLKRSEVGRFIAENMINDAESNVFGAHVARLLAADLGAFVGKLGPALLARLTGPPEVAASASREQEQMLTRLLGEDHLVGSAGEFGLLFAFLANKPGGRKLDDEPAISLSDVETMFVKKRLPDGWETWKKSRLDWVTNTTGLLVSAGEEYLRLRRATVS
jgi:hypothetical protein